MTVCATCHEPDTHDHSHAQHDCPGIGDIQIARQLGRGIIVNTAPRCTRIALAVLADAKWGVTMHDSDQINIADQVLYQVTGYDPETASLVLELVKDWRSIPSKQLTEAEAEEIRSRWQELYGKDGTAHPVELLEDEPSA